MTRRSFTALASRFASPLLGLGAAALVVSAAAAGPTATATGTPATATKLAASHQAIVKPGLQALFAKTAPTASLGVFVHFSGGTPAEHQALLDARGIKLAMDFQKYTDAAYVVGPVAALQALITEPSVYYIEENKKLRYMNGGNDWATRARVAQEPVSGGPYYDAKGNILTGAGVGVAVIDSGMDGDHPDMKNHVAHNYKIGCADAAVLASEMCTTKMAIVDTAVPGVTGGKTDSTGGHGSHCAGIATGDGSASVASYTVAGATPNQKGSYTGVAPKSPITMYGAGETLVILTPAAAFQHIIDNYKTNPVVVISNSYGSTAGDPYDPADVTSQLVKKVVALGATVAFAAGNDGDTTQVDKTAPSCKDPTPGVICVASYNDVATGSITGGLSSFSAQGKLGDPTTYPDIAAPGDLITATCTQPEPGQEVCATGAETKWQPYYGTISGTSMATPHIAGIVALLKQASPDLTPAQIEVLLQNTARKIVDAKGGAYETDPQNPGGTFASVPGAGTTNYRWGGGLANVQAALDFLGTKHGLANPPAAGASSTVIDGDTDATIPAAAADVISLVMQESSDANKVQGITYKLTVRDATSTGSGKVGYTLRQNVNGNPFSTSLVLSGTTLASSTNSLVNSAPATSMSLAGNVVTFFVPYTELGYPPANAPIHQINVESDDLTANQPLDFAPSPASLPGPAAAKFPAWGKPFTVQLPFTGTLPAADPLAMCTLPGITVATSPSGVTGNGGLPTKQDDLSFTAFAEPYITKIGAATTATTLAAQTVLTMKVDNLSPTPPPGYRWITYFDAPNGTSYWAGMSTSQSATPVFNYGTSSTTPDPSGTGEVPMVRTFTVVGTLNTLSNYNTNGTIQLVLDNAKFGNLKAGDTLKNIVTSIRQSTADSAGAAGLTVDTASAAISYKLVGNTYCAPNNPPVAKIVADKSSGTLAGADKAETLAVAFDATGSSDPDTAIGDTIARYDFNFGDGAVESGNTTGKTSHKYTTAGTYQATVMVTDSRGKAGTTAAAATVSVADDLLADAVSFTKQTGVTPGATVTSNAVTVSNVTAPIAINVTNGSYSVNGGDYTSAAGTVPDGATVTVRHTASSAYATQVDSVLTLGSDANAVKATFSSVTGAAPTVSPFTFAERKDVDVSTVVTSEAVTLAGTAGASFPISVSGGSNSQYSLDGGAFTSDPGTIKVGQKLVVRQTSSSAYSTKTTETVKVGTYATTFDVTTEAQPVADTKDHVPDAFDFGTQDGVDPGKVYTSKAIVPQNYDDAPISATQLSYSIDGGPFTTAAGTIKKGQSVRVQMTSSKASLGYAKGYITVGGVKATYTLRTKK